jgi:hypothetical protein
MTGVYVDVRRQEMLERPLLGGKLTSSEALSNYVRARWPHNTAKMIVKVWDLSLDEAKGIVAARASKSTLEKVFQPERGGWPVALCVLAGVIGQGVAEFFAQEAARAKDEAEQAQREADALAHAERIAIRSLAPDLARRNDPMGPRPTTVHARSEATPVRSRKVGR